MRTRTMFVALLLAGALPACAGGGDDANNSVGNEANTAEAELAEDNTTAVDPNTLYRETLECAAQMEASHDLTEQVTRTLTGNEATQMSMEVTLRSGRAGSLKAYAISAGGPLNLTMTAISEAIENRASAIVGERGSTSLEDYTSSVNAEADACYERLG